MNNEKTNLIDIMSEDRHKLPSLRCFGDRLYCGNLILKIKNNKVIVDTNTRFHLYEPYVFNLEYRREACYRVINIIIIIEMVISAIKGDYFMYVLRSPNESICINNESHLPTALKIAIGGVSLPVIITTNYDTRTNIASIQDDLNMIARNYGCSIYHPYKHLPVSCYSDEICYYEFLNSKFLLMDNIVGDIPHV